MQQQTFRQSMEVYRRNRGCLTDSRLGSADMRRLSIMHFATVTLFKDILKGLVATLYREKEREELRYMTSLRRAQCTCVIHHRAAVRHDHTFLNEIRKLPKDRL